MEVNIRIAGSAGQGISTATGILGKAVTRAGLFAYSYNDAESRIRGGLNFSQITCSDKPTGGVTDGINILVALSRDALNEYSWLVAEDGIVLTSGDWEHPLTAPFNLGLLASKAGSAKAVAGIGAAVLSAIMAIDSKYIKKVLLEWFESKPKLAKVNILGVNLGYEGVSLWEPGDRFKLPKKKVDTDRLWISGGESIALGAIAGGVSFYAGYPMSPSTSIMTALASVSKEAGIIVEQAEDEIAAINMVAGASYAGVRAMTATSGGGFSLMNEGLSLMGMIEVPAVIVLAQRPGPATGLPTRTAQGDLNFARHAGHGSFARIIMAPDSIKDCCYMAAKALDLAEKYQVPVIIMTDQLLQDSQATIEPPDIDKFPSGRYYLTSSELASMESYQRYAQTDSGVSPMAAPGASEHVVIVDSDEHDENGHMIESAEIAARMADKRRRKAETILGLAEQPVIKGEVDGKPLVVSWGSTYETITQARAKLKSDGVDFAHMHMRWLWPLPREGALVDAVNKASRVVVVENSPNCDMESILREVTLRGADALITKMDGRPFTINELAEKIGEVVS